MNAESSVTWERWAGHEQTAPQVCIIGNGAVIVCFLMTTRLVNWRVGVGPFRGSCGTDKIVLWIVGR